MKSKGALELSMNTIVVIVIAAIVLSLGIVFVRSMFTGLEELSSDAFAKADASISDITTYQGLLSISPGEISVKKGSAKTVNVIASNQDYDELRFNLVASSDNPKIECLFADTKTTTSKSYSLFSGEEASVKLIVDEKGGKLGVNVCSVTMQSNQNLPDNSEELVINVVKS